MLAQLKHTPLNLTALGALVMKELERRQVAQEVLDGERKDLAIKIAELTQEVERAAGTSFAGTAPRLSSPP